MEKKSKVTKVTKMDKKDNYGNTSFVVELDNGDKGFYTSKSEDQTKFVVGKESGYLIEEKQGKSSKYFKITVPGSEGGGFGGGGFAKKVDPKVQIIGFAMSYTKDLIVAGKLDYRDIEKEFNRIHNLMASKL